MESSTNKKTANSKQLNSIAFLNLAMKERFDTTRNTPLIFKVPGLREL